MGRIVDQWEASLDGWLTETPPAQRETLRDEFDRVPRPERFPADAGVIAGEDGRIRVLLHAPGREVPAAVDPSPSKPGEPPRLRGGGSRSSSTCSSLTAATSAGSVDRTGCKPIRPGVRDRPGLGGARDDLGVQPTDHRVGERSGSLPPVGTWCVIWAATSASTGTWPGSGVESRPLEEARACPSFRILHGPLKSADIGRVMVRAVHRPGDVVAAVLG